MVLGASDSPMRYSFLAVRRLKSYDHPVVAIGKKEGMIDDTKIITEHPSMDDVDTITLYLNPAHQEQYYDYIYHCTQSASSLIPVPKTENWQAC